MSVYPRGTGDGLAPLFDTLDNIKRRLRELETPSGTQLTSLVEQVKAKLAELDATVNTLVAAALGNYYTKSETDNKITNPGNISPGNVTTSGNVTIGGALRAPSVPVTILTSNYFATYATTDDGTLGHAPSSERFKQDISPASIDLTALDRAEVVQFRYKQAVVDHGDNAATVVGGIAEQFAACGLEFAVIRDADGNAFSIDRDALLFALLAKVQQLSASPAPAEEHPQG